MTISLEKYRVNLPQLQIVDVEGVEDKDQMPLFIQDIWKKVFKYSKEADLVALNCTSSYLNKWTSEYNLQKGSFSMKENKEPGANSIDTPFQTLPRTRSTRVWVREPFKLNTMIRIERAPVCLNIDYHYTPYKDKTKNDYEHFKRHGELPNVRVFF